MEKSDRYPAGIQAATWSLDAPHMALYSGRSSTLSLSVSKLPQLLTILLTALVAAVVSAILVWAIRPLLVRYALARPNARSSHRVPTPQGGGIAVIASTLVVSTAFILVATTSTASLPLLLFAATVVMALVGAVDDIRPIPVLPRLLLQGLCVAAALYAAGDGRIWDAAPFWIERALLFFAMLWFVNLVNFMDGLDLITVAEVVPVSAALVLLGSLAGLPLVVILIAAALGGAMLGFAPFNRPVARVFLGDVGSLPIGLLLAWCLVMLACQGQIVAAILLPLYYCADATVTLLRRAIKREKVWIAHRSHFYQRATDNGFTVTQVVGRVFALNVMLACLAVVSALTGSFALKLTVLLIGALLVAWLMHRFSRHA